MKHTKGPWERTKKGDDGLISIYSPDNGTIAHVVEDMVVQEANANFIAGAPELYNSAKRLLIAFHKTKTLEELLSILGPRLSAISAACKKMEGGEKDGKIHG